MVLRRFPLPTAVFYGLGIVSSQPSNYQIAVIFLEESVQIFEPNSNNRHFLLQITDDHLLLEMFLNKHRSNRKNNFRPLR